MILFITKARKRLIPTETKKLLRTSLSKSSLNFQGLVLLIYLAQIILP
jgi:hypothetical protein